MSEELKVIEEKKVGSGMGGRGYRILFFQGGYTVESIFRAMSKGSNTVHDKYGRQYDFDDLDQIRPEEMFPNVDSVKKYIKNGYNTAKQLAKKKKKKDELIEQEKRKLLARLKELEEERNPQAKISEERELPEWEAYKRLKSKFAKLQDPYF